MTDDAKQSCSNAYSLTDTVDEMMAVGAWSYDPQSGEVQWSPEIFSIYGTNPDEPVTLEHAFAPFAPEARATLKETMEKALAQNRRYELTLPMDVNGTRKWVRSVARPKCGGAGKLKLFGTLEDVTDILEQRDQVDSNRGHSVPTGLPNEIDIDRKLRAIIDSQQDAAMHTLPYVVCVLEILATPGTPPDEIEITQRGFAIALSQRQGFAARFNDGRFLLIFEEDADFDAAEHVLHHVTALSRLRRNDGVVLALQLRCGWLRLEGNRTQADDIMQDLELTLRTARTHSGKSVVPYSPALRENEKRRSKVAQQFRQALENDEVVPHYHPIVCLNTGKLSGFEVLARWNHPTRGVIAPNLFMQVFDDSAITVRLSHVIVKKVLADMASWHRDGLHFGRVGINVTALDLQQDQFSQNILAMLDEHGLSPRHLALEIGEAVILQSPSPDVREHIDRLRDAGVIIAIDDYGTHAASLQQLKNAPCDIMKIDRSFIGNMTVSSKDCSIVKALIQMSNDFGFNTVAQGIETREEAAQLSAMGCNRGQGFYYAKPASADDVRKTLVPVFDRSTLRQEIEPLPKLMPNAILEERTGLLSD
ncbi:MAG: EAL domain-containing protein [Pseudomonadota bacterium]